MSGFDLLGGARIKSLQTGEVFFDSGVATVDIAIAEVDLSKTIVLTAGRSDGYPSDLCFRGRLISSTGLQLSRFNPGALNRACARWYVIELNGVKSVQSGLATLNQGSGTLDITISEVNTSKAIPMENHSFEPNGYNYISNAVGTIYLSSSTTLTIKRGYLSYYGYWHISWFVVELE